MSSSCRNCTELTFWRVVVVQSLNCVCLFATSWAAAHQASLSFTVSQSLLKLMSIELMMPSNHLILCRPLLLLPSVLPSIRVFSNKPALRISWQLYSIKIKILKRKNSIVTESAACGHVMVVVVMVKPMETSLET